MTGHKRKLGVLALLLAAILGFVLSVRSIRYRAAKPNVTETEKGRVAGHTVKRHWDGRIEDAGTGLALLERMGSLPKTVTLRSSRSVALAFDANLRSAIEINIRNATGLSALSDREVQLLVDDFLLFQEIKTELERQLVRRVDRIDDVDIFELPPYPELGAVLEEMFHAQLKEDFSPEQYQSISSSLAGIFDAYFNYFGELRKTLHVSRTKETGKIAIYWVSERDIEQAGEPKGTSPRQRIVDATGTTIIDSSSVGVGEYGYLEGMLH